MSDVVVWVIRSQLGSRPYWAGNGWTNERALSYRHLTIHEADRVRGEIRGVPTRSIRLVRREKPPAAVVSEADLRKANAHLAAENLRLTDELETARILLLDVGEIARRGAALKVRE